MRVLGIILAAILFIALGAIVLVCASWIANWTVPLKDIVKVAWGSIWRLSTLAIALFALIALVESMKY